MAKEPEKIGNVILKTLSRMGFAERLHKQSAVIGWKAIVGDTIAAETEALRIDGDTIEIETLFGEGKIVQGRVAEIDFMKSRVVIEE